MVALFWLVENGASIMASVWPENAVGIVDGLGGVGTTIPVHPHVSLHTELITGGSHAEHAPSEQVFWQVPYTIQFLPLHPECRLVAPHDELALNE